MTKTELKPEEYLERAWKFCQSCLSVNPVLVVGSGASVPYGFPTMQVLGDYITQSLEQENAQLKNDTHWNEFKTEIYKVGLEAAIDKSNLAIKEELYEKIKAHVWMCINKKDILIKNLILNKTEIAIEKLLRYLIRSDNNLIRVVTTNYDRIIEYAAENIEIFWRTNFHAGHMGAWRGDRACIEYWSSNKKVQEKVVEIWKVHGSLDWFLIDDTNIRSISGLSALSPNVKPLIVPPSMKKLAEAYAEPYRKIIQESDRVLRDANGFFCIGYGFNDDHIQVKLLERARRDHKPVVILAKSLTNNVKKYFLDEKSQIDFAAFEEAENGTMFYDKMHKTGVLIEGQHVWDLAHFVENVI